VSDLGKELAAVGHPHVVVLGDVMLDRYTYGEVGRISPEAPIPVLRAQRNEERLGGAGGVAADLGVLGARVSILGLLGADGAGDAVRRLASAQGMDGEGLVTSAGRSTTVKERHVARGSAYGQQVLRVDREDTTPCSEEDEGRLLAALDRVLTAQSVLVLSDYAKGVLTQGVLARAIGRGRGAGLTIIVDPKSRDVARYRGASVLTPNRRETAEATGIFPGDPEAVRRAGERLLDLADLEAAVITLDRDGMALVRRDGPPVMANAAAREVFDVTGAGDMVVAMLALCRGGGLGWEEAVHLANAAAGVAVAKLGNVPVTRAEVVAALGGDARVSGKVVTLEELVPTLSARRGAGARVVFTNGCFDLLHAGHTRYLAQARSYGDLLVVGVNDDASIQRLKGPGRPVMPLTDRAEVLAALACVDYVVAFSQDTPARLVEAVLPDVLVKGEDWKDKGVVGRQVVEAAGGRVVLAPLVAGHSTSDIIARIRGR
jgi:D-beta-D-heptose 7-phosphate kinase/D-beta-D-heptose 1-phosphate adenosyltransferase